jgi:hypothetical protein
MTSLVSFSNLVNGEAAPISETFESYNPYTVRPRSPIPRCKASDVGREKRKSSIDAYLQTKSLWIGTIGKMANPFVTIKRPMTKAVHSTSRRHGSRA